MAAYNQDGITIGTISGGIVNFGGAVTIAPISITKTYSGSENQGGATAANSGSDSTTKTEGNGRSSFTGTGSNDSEGSSFTNTSLPGILDVIRRSLA